jgi:hypothetical protein
MNDIKVKTVPTICVPIVFGGSRIKKSRKIKRVSIDAETYDKTSKSKIPKRAFTMNTVQRKTTTKLTSAICTQNENEVLL